MPYVNLGPIVKYMSFSKLCGRQSIWRKIVKLHFKKSAIKYLSDGFFRLKISYVVQEKYDFHLWRLKKIITVAKKKVAQTT